MYGCQIGTKIYRQCARVNQNVYQTLRTVHRSTNHYETLQLKQNCTAKDIRDAFIKLSKENHPDTSPNTLDNAIIFRNIVEAYKVLGKADSRAIYDTVMNQDQESNGHSYGKSNSNPSSAYYGVFGSKRISNTKIVLYCMIFMIVGVIIQSLLIRHSVTFTREKLDRISMEAGKVHSRVRANAEEHGNHQQIEKLKQKFNDGK